MYTLLWLGLALLWISGLSAGMALSDAGPGRIHWEVLALIDLAMASLFIAGAWIKRRDHV